MTHVIRLALAAAAALCVAACGGAEPAAGIGGAPGAVVVRVGHFPNVTHAHGLIAHGTTRAATAALPGGPAAANAAANAVVANAVIASGWFEERLGPGVTVEWYTYNAGPSAMEAILAGSIDLTYVGPNPALNAHIRAKGSDVRVIAGATRGGAALVVRNDGTIKGPLDLKGRKLATPQLGNTQDVSARAWLAAAGLVVTQTGGDVAVVPTQNPDQLALFKKGDLDAVWTVEPWVSRLEREAGGKILVAEDDAVTTVLASSVKFLAERPTLAAKFAKAHDELSAWITAHPAEAQAQVRAELLAETKHAMPPELLAHAWPRMRFTSAIAADDFASFLRSAQAAGFLKDAGDVSRLVQKP